MVGHELLLSFHFHLVDSVDVGLELLLLNKFLFIHYPLVDIPHFIFDLGDLLLANISQSSYKPWMIQQISNR